MDCQEFREITDSYLSGELLIETNYEFLRHLESCAACREELAACRDLRMRLRSAVKNAPEMQFSNAFASKAQATLRESALRPNVWGKFKNGGFYNSKLLAIAAVCLLLIALFGAVWFINSPSKNSVVERNQSNSIDEIARPSSPVTQAVHAAWQAITNAAIGDHQNCALHFRLEEKPITLSEAAEKYGRFNKDLDKAIVASLREIYKKNASDKIEFLEAHSCVFQDRRFAHIVLRRREKIISILVTDIENLPGASSQAITNQSSEAMSVARFCTAHHAVLVISDLTGQENLAVISALSPALRQHIEQFESKV